MAKTYQKFQQQKWPKITQNFKPKKKHRESSKNGQKTFKIFLKKQPKI